MPRFREVKGIQQMTEFSSAAASRFAAVRFSTWLSGCEELFLQKQAEIS
jgi:hypothetical protein